MAQASVDAASSGGKAAWAQALPVAEKRIKDLQDNLAKLNGNALNDIIADRISSKDPNKIASAKQEFKRQLGEELKLAVQQYNSIFAHSGLTGGAQPQAPTAEPAFDYVPGKGLQPR
jgi:hypothetical protein